MLQIACGTGKSGASVEPADHGTEGCKLVLHECCGVWLCDSVMHGHEHHDANNNAVVRVSKESV